MIDRDITRSPGTGRLSPLDRQTPAPSDRSEVRLPAPLEVVRRGAEDLLDLLGVGACADRLSAAAGTMELGDAPWSDATELPANVTLTRLRQDPALRRQLLALAERGDPAVKAYMEATARALSEEALTAAIRGGGDRAAVFARYRDDVAFLARATGLGPHLSATAKAVPAQVARNLLDAGVDAAHVAANPALAQLLASLQADPDPAVRQRLQETVGGWATAALERRLQGAEGQQAIDAALQGFQGELAQLAQATGLGELIKTAAGETLRSQEGRIKELADKGKMPWDHVADFLGDMVGGVLKGLGDVIDAATGLAGDVIRTGAEFAGDLADAALDAAGEAAETVIGAAGTVTGGALDAVGAEAAAEAVRQGAAAAGAAVRDGLDQAGDAADDAIEKAGAGIGGLVEFAGDLADGTLDVAGTLAQEGLAGAVEQLLDGALGPEQPEFAGQIDGFTGMITNRLGVGDGVFLSMELNGRVGVGVFGGAELNGTARIGRNADGTISLSLAVAGEVEAGMSMETGADVDTDEASPTGAKMEAGVSGFVGAQGQITLRFDPTDAEDVARLKAIMEPDLGDLVDGVTSLNPLALASPSAGALQEAMRVNYVSHETGLSAGIRAEFGAAADLGPVKAKLGVDASFVTGTNQKFYENGDVAAKYYFNASASISLGAKVGGVGGGPTLRLGHVESLSVRRDAQGNLVGIECETALPAGVALSQARDPKTGKHKLKFGENSVGSNTVLKVTQSLSPAGLVEVQRLAASGVPLLEAFQHVARQPEMAEATLSTTEVDSVTIGGRVTAGVAGVQVSVGAKVTVGRTHTTSEKLEEQDLLDLELLLGRS